MGIVGALLLSSCGGAAWGHEDGFASQLSQGCNSEKECDELVGAARWRSRRCGATNREAEECAEANEHLEAAENLAQAFTTKVNAEQAAEQRSEKREGELAKKRLSLECQTLEDQLKTELSERDKRIEQLVIENKVLRDEVKSSEEIVKTLTPTEKEK